MKPIEKYLKGVGWATLWLVISLIVKGVLFNVTNWIAFYGGIWFAVFLGVMGVISVVWAIGHKFNDRPYRKYLSGRPRVIANAKEMAIGIALAYGLTTPVLIYGGLTTVGMIGSSTLILPYIAGLYIISLWVISLAYLYRHWYGLSELKEDK